MNGLSAQMNAPAKDAGFADEEDKTNSQFSSFLWTISITQSSCFNIINPLSWAAFIAGCCGQLQTVGDCLVQHILLTWGTIIQLIPLKWNWPSNWRALTLPHSCFAGKRINLVGWGWWWCAAVDLRMMRCMFDGACCKGGIGANENWLMMSWRVAYR